MANNVCLFIGGIAKNADFQCKAISKSRTQGIHQKPKIKYSLLNFESSENKY